LLSSKESFTTGRAVIRREPTPSAEIASYKRTYQALAAFPTIGDTT
jgi:hypothetical protein